MTALSTAIPAPERAVPTAPPPRGLDARLAAVSALMDDRLALAALAVAVNTALRVPDVEDVDLADVVTGPVLLPEPDEQPYPTPAAATLQRAARRLRTGGWCRGSTVDAEGARCLYGAIHAEAPTARAESDALALLLVAIRRRFPGADTVPSANDQLLPDARTAVRLLGEAAALADARGL